MHAPRSIWEIPGHPWHGLANRRPEAEGAGGPAGATGLHRAADTYGWAPQSYLPGGGGGVSSKKITSGRLFVPL